MGSKLTNLYSKEFRVEVKENKKILKLIWKNNMKKLTENEFISKPELINSFINKNNKHISDGNYVLVSFTIDEKLFFGNAINSDVYQYLLKHALDLNAIVPSINVWLNNEKVPINSFHDYIKLYKDIGEFHISNDNKSTF